MEEEEESAESDLGTVMKRGSMKRGSIARLAWICFGSRFGHGRHYHTRRGPVPENG
jgi:hypothetical protein